MDKIHFDVETSGFYGAYWDCGKGTDAGMITMLGDDPEDYMAKGAVKWLHSYGINVLTMSPGKKDYGHHNYPLERIEKAIAYLKSRGMKKIGIVGASTTGMLALTAASYYSDITLTLALTPSDFIWQGFMQGKKDGCGEWPIEGESTISKDGKPLPYMPFVYQHPDYWHKIQESTKGTGNYLCSRVVFDDSEAAGLLKEDMMIKVENIKGKILFIGAEDDTLWDTAKYIRRMDERLKAKPHECSYEVHIYKYGTHFVFPESLLKKLLSIAAGPAMKIMFRSAKEHPDECRQTRIDIEKNITRAINEWK